MTDNSSRKLMIETRAAKQLRDFLLTLTDDQEAISDTIDGQTNVRDAIHGALLANDLDEAMLNGLKLHIKTLGERAERISYRIDQRRTAMQKAMEAAEIPKIQFPEASLSLRDIPRGLEIQDEAVIPVQYWVDQEPKLDRSALKADLLAGSVISGAVLDNGGTGITIRRK